ncbi:MAG: hypothetical protein JSS02_19860, partial [Planctomycetes bacterium]|nr:hypothetical protein [Planctomycetota bacterium]
YQSFLMSQWRESGKTWEKPRFRVAFLTRSVERSYHLLATAAAVTESPARRLVYAAPLDLFLGTQDLLREPIFNDHLGHWQALVNPHPTAVSLRAPVRLPTLLENPMLLA